MDKKHALRQTRHLRVRRKIEGSPERPRLAVFRSLKHIYAQVIDDTSGHTLVSASSLDPALREQFANGGNVAAAKEVGRLVGQRAVEAGINSVVFDRGGFKYHGRIAAIADAAREAGLQF